MTLYAVGSALTVTVWLPVMSAVQLVVAFVAATV